MPVKPRPKRFARLEWLEPKTMLAGDVTAQFVDGDLIITGDSADNSIRLLLDAIHGENDVNGVPTTINGGTVGFGITDWPRDVIVQLGSGNDVLQSSGLLQFNRDVVIEGGPGSDLIHLKSEALNRVGRNLVLRGGDESDRIFINDSSAPDQAWSFYIVGSLIVDGGMGNDEVRLAQINCSVNATIDLGFGADLCEMTLGFFGNVMQINGWEGYDSITVEGSFAPTGSLNGNAGIATIVARHSRFEVLVMTSTGGDDFLWLDTSVIHGTLVFTSDAGSPGDASNDYLLINDSRVGELQSVSGGGSDRLQIQRSTLFNLYAVLGEGSDWLQLENVRVDNSAQADGGNGFDLFTSLGNLLNNFANNGFEVFY